MFASQAGRVVPVACSIWQPLGNAVHGAHVDHHVCMRTRVWLMCCSIDMQHMTDAAPCRCDDQTASLLFACRPGDVTVQSCLGHTHGAIGGGPHADKVPVLEEGAVSGATQAKVGSRADACTCACY